MSSAEPTHGGGAMTANTEVMEARRPGLMNAAFGFGKDPSRAERLTCARG